MILADSQQVAIRRSLLPVLSAFFYKCFTHLSFFFDFLSNELYTIVEYEIIVFLLHFAWLVNR